MTTKRTGSSLLADARFLAAFVTLAHNHADGTVTARETATQLRLSLGTPYEFLGVVYETLKLTSAICGAETIEHNDVELKSQTLREMLSE